MSSARNKDRLGGRDPSDRRVYHRPDMHWLASCSLGMGVHWTAQTMPRSGSACSFEDAVDRFRLDAFLADVEASDVDYVIFTVTHALQMLPCPHPVVDMILPGRTSARDVLGEISDGLAGLGKKLIVYYNHSCNQGDDPPWEQAVGYHDQDKARLAENLCAIVRWMGDRYGERIRAWWFDSAFSLDASGPYHSVTTDLRGFQFPWEDFTVAAKSGGKDRLVTYNPGAGHTHLYTEHQDYQAGEITNLDAPPTRQFLESGLLWHGWTFLDDHRWVYLDNSHPPHPPIYSDAHIAQFVSTCRKHHVPMGFNVVSFQDGSLAQASLQQLSRVSKILRKQE